ncbi:MAG: nucleotidyltransferase domain-containing protein [Candidatus Woesearchaeota archaeon]
MQQIRPDKYLQKVIEYSKSKFGDNLAAIVIHGSYALGYFDKRKSDYDLSFYFKNKIPAGKETLKKKFPKIWIHYFMTLEDVLEYCHLSHFTLYITLLTKGSKAIYSTKEYRQMLKELKKKNLRSIEFDTADLKYKYGNEINVFQKSKSYSALKWALPMIRKRLQLLSYLSKSKLVWDLDKNLNINRKCFSEDEIRFMKNLNKRLFQRDNHFSDEDIDKTINLCQIIQDKIFLRI